MLSRWVDGIFIILLSFTLNSCYLLTVFIKFSMYSLLIFRNFIPLQHRLLRKQPFLAWKTESDWMLITQSLRKACKARTDPNIYLRGGSTFKRRSSFTDEFRGCHAASSLFSEQNVSNWEYSNCRFGTHNNWNKILILHMPPKFSFLSLLLTRSVFDPLITIKKSFGSKRGNNKSLWFN
jgi:hypothetical protein